MECLKLYLFIRNEVGKRNFYVGTDSISKAVAQVIKKYWDMAGFITIERID